MVFQVNQLVIIYFYSPRSGGAHYEHNIRAYSTQSQHTGANKMGRQI